MPIVVAFAGQDEGSPHTPTELDLVVSTTLRLGADTATEGVPLGTSLKSYIDGHTHLPGTFTTPVGSGGGGGPVTGVSGAPTTSSPSPSSVVKVAP